tara:strand:- start:103 stop:261 length:159 start_codon:yes stop_codon:yes gene_type:complete
MKKYKVYINKNDNGEKMVILTSGSSVQNVEKSIMDFFKCPRSCLIVLELKTN